MAFMDIAKAFWIAAALRRAQTPWAAGNQDDLLADLPGKPWQCGRPWQSEERIKRSHTRVAFRGFLLILVKLCW